MTSRRKRPRDPAQLAKLIVDIATGEVEDREPEGKPKDPAAVERGRRGGTKGGPARADVVPKERRIEISRKAAKARWSKKKVVTPAD
jgi:hypothetical protein